MEVKNKWLDALHNGVNPYQKHLDLVNRTDRENSRKARDIGPLPPSHNLEQVEECRHNFRLFCEVYFSNRFSLDWSADHLKVIDRIEETVLRGGLYAIAMPRGSGKTSICECAVIWAILYGHHQFVVLVASDQKAAQQSLASIKAEFETNDELAADFPSAIFPIQKLEGIYNRCQGQLVDGERTKISWTAEQVSMPCVAGSPCSGAIIRVAGLTGRIRGQKATSPHDGEPLRPSLVLIDDPQTNESARSAAQSKTRLDIISGDVLGLAGPKKKIAALCTATVIAQGDLADELLTVEKHPDWQGHRCKMVYRWPTSDEAKKLWEQYADLRSDCLLHGQPITKATEFYVANRATMDGGAEVAWEDRYNADEASALQHAYNLKLRDEAAFNAEYQNEPQANQHVAQLLTVDQLEKHTSSLAKRLVPMACHKVVAFIDVMQSALYYAVVAVGDDFSASLIDYGTWPDQQRDYFTLAGLGHKLGDRRKGTVEAILNQGLGELVSHLADSAYKRPDDNSEIFCSRILIDAGWQTETVKNFCKSSEHRRILLPSFGRAFPPSRKQLPNYNKTFGDRTGFYWRLEKGKDHLIFDANAYKDFLTNRLAIAVEEAGSLLFYKPTRKGQHRMLAEHLTAEFPVATTAYGVTVNLWQAKPNRDNHLFDCLAGCLVAASVEGITATGHNTRPLRSGKKRPRAQVTF
jgi:hypothetical protein